MPSVKTIKLIFATLVLMGSIVMIGMTINAGSTGPKAPIRERILRAKDKTKLPPTPTELAELKKKAKVQEEDKRTLKIREFKDMPLKIQAIRNVDSETWYKNLEIEVKNIGTKPIYGILAFLAFPDHKPGGRDIAMVLSFGELKYWDIDVLADPKDIHLDLGQTYVFTISAKDARILQKKQEKAPHEFRKLDFHFTVINFGDGTGFQATTPVDARKTKQPNGPTDKKHHRNKRSFSSVRSPPQDG